MQTRISHPVLALVFTLLTACGGGESDPPDTVASQEEPNAAAAEAAGEQNTRELASYDVTMADLRRLEKAQLNLEELKRSRPDLKEKLEGDDSEEDDSGGDTFGDVERRISEVPEARQAIESAGMEVRDFVVVLMALVYAGMADAMIDHGMNEDSIFRDLQVNPENVEFVRRHEAEVARVLQIGRN